MKKTFCDRCSEEVSRRTGTHFVSDKDSGPADFDLCKSCVSDLTNWLKGEPIPKQTIT